MPDITTRRFQRLTTPLRSSSPTQYYRRIYTTVNNNNVLQTLSLEENVFFFFSWMPVMTGSLCRWPHCSPRQSGGLLCRVCQLFPQVSTPSQYLYVPSCLEISDLCNLEVSLWWTLPSSTRAQASWGLPSSPHLGCGRIFLECLLIEHDVKSLCFRWPSGCNPPGRCTFKGSPGTPRSSWPGWPRSCSPIMEELKYFLISVVQFYFKVLCLYFTGPGCC